MHKAFLTLFFATLAVATTHAQYVRRVLAAGMSPSGPALWEVDSTGQLLSTGFGPLAATGNSYLPQVMVMGIDASGKFHPILLNSDGSLAGTGGGGGGSGTVNSATAGQLAYYAANGTVVSGETMGGDCTIAGGGAITCTKTNGSAFGSLALLNTVNNANWSGTPLSSGNGGMTWPAAAGVMVYAGGSAYGTSLTAPAGAFVGMSNASLTDASPIVWNAQNVLYANAVVTLANTLNTRALNVTNLAAGGVYTLTAYQDATGGVQMTPGTGCTWLYNSGAAVSNFSLPIAPSSMGIIRFSYDGTNCIVTQPDAYPDGESSYAAGFKALASITTGINNNAIGWRAGYNVTTGSYNDFMGHDAGFAAGATGHDNVAVGEGALFGNGVGSNNVNDNVAVGSTALLKIQNGFNVGVGYGALTNAGNTQQNTALGFNACSAVTTGADDTCLGASTVIPATNSNSTAIGQGATVTASHQIMMGTASETVVIPGSLNITNAFALPSGTTATTQAVSDNSQKLGTTGFDYALFASPPQLGSTTANSAILTALATHVRTITASETAPNNSDYTVLCDATAGAVLETLYATPILGQIINFKKIDSSSNTCQIKPSTGTIDGYASLFVDLQDEMVTIQYVGSNIWYLVGQYNWDWSGFNNPMTTQYDLIAGGTGGTATRFAGNTANNAAVLTSTGNGSATTGLVWNNAPALSAANMTGLPLGSGVTGNLPNANLASLSANTVLGAVTATTPSGLAVPSCSGAANALTWTSGTGFGCNTISSGASGTLVQSSATNTSISATNLVSSVPSTPGVYALDWVVSQTSAGVGCTGATSITLSDVFTDPNESSSLANTLGVMSISGNGTVGRMKNGAETVLAKNATALQYSSTVTQDASCSTKPNYQVSLVYTQIH